MSDQKLFIKHWALEDRPREKLLMKGAMALSNAELIAILIRSGNKEESAVDLSKRILRKVNNNLNMLGKQAVEEFMENKGIGEAKAITIVAALELGRRRKQEEAEDKLQITSSNDAYDYFHPLLADLQYEEFWILMLNRANKIIERKKISQGGTSGTVIDVKIILKNALDKFSSSIILCHNHPSGSLKPSKADTDITEKIHKASKLLDISLLDHIIIGEKGFYSFADNGLI